MKKLLLLSALLIFGFGYGQDGYGEYITSGDKKINDFEKAYEIYKNSSQSEDYKRSKINDAIKDYSSAILVDPNNPTGYYKRGWAYFKAEGIINDDPWMRACMDFVRAARLGNKDALDWIKCTSYKPVGNYRIFSDFYMNKYSPGNDWVKNEEYVKQAIYWDSSYYLPYVANTEIQRKLLNYEGVIENADKGIELINLLPNRDEVPSHFIETLKRYKKIALKRIKTK